MIPDTMHAVQLTGHGGPEKLVYRRDVPVPRPGAGEVLIRVAAAGINNTDINTRIGWYSKTVSGDTASGAAGAEVDDDGSWSGQPLQFPRIQGADVCGTIVALGEGVEDTRLGQRVLVQTMQPAPGGEPFGCLTFGSEVDGGFAQYAVARAGCVYAVDSDWSDAELASVPCAWSTAENMLHRAGVGAERVLITGASGGVGAAAAQLAKRRGAQVVAQCGAAKADEVAALGADRLVERGADLVAQLGEEQIDVVVDLVAGPQWPSLLQLLRRGGRYITAGAIAGPLVELDVRTLYLKDLSLLGSTYQSEEVFPSLVGYIERGEVRPTLAATYPLEDIHRAQEDFLAKAHTGKLVLIPPA